MKDGNFRPPLASQRDTKRQKQGFNMELRHSGSQTTTIGLACALNDGGARAKLLILSPGSFFFMEGDVVARCHHLATTFALDDTRNTLAVKSANAPYELNVLF